MLLHLVNLKKNIANIIPQRGVKLHQLNENKYYIGIIEAKVGMRNKNWIQGLKGLQQTKKSMYYA